MLAIAEKDSRLYMTFPIDFHRHPKVDRLTVEQRWAFVEMNGEARIADNDGVFSADDAEFMWGAETLAALVNSHPSRPLVERRGEFYVIREYAKHQHTKADREAYSLKKSEAAKERWRREKERKADEVQVQSGSNAGALQVECETMPQSQSQSQDLLLTDLVGLGSNAREKSTDEESIEQIEASKRTAETQRLNLDRIRALASERCDRDLGYGEALRLGVTIMSKAKRSVGNPSAYVARAFDEWQEVQKLIDTEVRL